MGLLDKMRTAETSTWMTDALSEEERRTAAFIAEIAVSIQTKRKVAGLTQKELAEKLGVTQAMVSRWENGEENFTAATLAKISAALNTPLCNPLSA